MDKKRLSHLATGMTLSCLAGLVQGEIRSLSQDEMLETYIQDSAIIVSPSEKKKDVPNVTQEEAKESSEQGPSRKEVLEALIRPGEALTREADSLAQSQALRSRRFDTLQQARSMAEQELYRLQQRFPEGRLQGEGAMLVSRIPPQPIFDGSSVAIPETPFNKSLLNDQLELGFDGQTLSFGIGQPAGIRQINLPHGIHEGPVELNPRPGGGFDLSIDVPQ